MFDNLRRSLMAPASVLSLVIAWTLPLPFAAVWTAFVVAMLAIPTLPSLLAGLVPRHSGIVLRSHFRAVAADAQLAATRTALTLALLAHQSWLMCDAIGRTLYRLFVSRRNLLEWVTAQEQNSKRLDVAGHYRLMAGALVISLLVLGLVALGHASALLALPFILAWQLSPLHRVLGEPAVAGRGIAAGFRRRRPGAAPGGPPRLALLRFVRHGRGQHAAARQLPGRAVAGAGPPHVTDQPRPVPAVDRHGTRLGLGRHRSTPSSGSSRRSRP